jgi:hypothetical protein
VAKFVEQEPCPVSDAEVLIAGATTLTFNEAARNLELIWIFWISS